MGRKKTPGLYSRKGIWHIDKKIRGRRLCESTGTSNLEEAEAYLVNRIDKIRQAEIYGVRPERSFRQAATYYLKQELKEGNLRSLNRISQSIKVVEPFIGDLPLQHVHMGTLQTFIDTRRKNGISNSTIGRDLSAVRRILNLAARLWRDEHGLTWLETPPLIQLPSTPNARKAYPLSWEEQQLLFEALPAHLQAMALFKVNTGCRDNEVCQLQWDWEVKIPEFRTSVFIIPEGIVKNKQERLVVLNRVASSIIQARRNKHDEYVFTFKNSPITRMNNSAWRTARSNAADRYEDEFDKPCPNGFKNIRVHDLKHTFGRRLRAAGVSFEDRQDLLGHRSGRITTHYSAAELGNLIDAANRVCESIPRKTPALVMHV